MFAGRCRTSGGRPIDPTGKPPEERMSRDTLSDLLRAVRLRGAVFFHVDGEPPWVAETPHAREIIAAIMPGAEHMFEFHACVSGACWAAIAGESPVRLEAGDVVLFPHGDAHVMSSAPGLRAPVDRDLFSAPRAQQLPYALSLNNADLGTGSLGGDHDRANLVCGFLGLDARPFNPLLASLPRILRVPRGMTGTDSWVAALMGAVVNESSTRRPGGEAVLERMSEMLFVEILRRYIDSLPDEQTGWLAGIRDPAVGRALALIHGEPSEAWTLERLSEGAGLSRSSLHDRFIHFIGHPPMTYLTQWRMQVASGMLRETNAKIIEVAMNVGYESEAAFSRAFKRVAGRSPGAWRKMSQGAA
jgi:AraC-like DNA-binding protein